jgi:hypothetical protein
MGRELKRVALDFDWPLDSVWHGYVNPLYTARQCSECEGTGYSPRAKYLKDRWYGYVRFDPAEKGSEPFKPSDNIIIGSVERNIKNAPEFYGSTERDKHNEAQRLCRHFNSSWSHHLDDADVAALVNSNRLFDLTHTWNPKVGWRPKEPSYTPSAREVNEWSLSGMGHDGVNSWVCIRAECERQGVPHTCAVCDGEGCLWTSPEAKEAYETWKRIEPPTGDGFQIWETVSEGSPISPVFSTARDLAAHMATTKRGGDEGTSFDTWLAFIEGPGWAPSLVVTSAGVIGGVKAVVELGKD